jgi:hypothetical protein
VVGGGLGSDSREHEENVEGLSRGVLKLRGRISEVIYIQGVPRAKTTPRAPVGPASVIRVVDMKR